MFRQGEVPVTQDQLCSEESTIETCELSTRHQWILPKQKTQTVSSTLNSTHYKHSCPTETQPAFVTTCEYRLYDGVTMFTRTESSCTLEIFCSGVSGYTDTIKLRLNSGVWYPSVPYAKNQETYARIVRSIPLDKTVLGDEERPYAIVITQHDSPLLTIPPTELNTWVSHDGLRCLAKLADFVLDIECLGVSGNFSVSSSGASFSWTINRIELPEDVSATQDPTVYVPAEVYQCMKKLATLLSYKFTDFSDLTKLVNMGWPGNIMATTSQIVADYKTTETRDAARSTFVVGELSKIRKALQGLIPKSEEAASELACCFTERHKEAGSVGYYTEGRYGCGRSYFTFTADRQYDCAYEDIEFCRPSTDVPYGSCYKKTGVLWPENGLALYDGFARITESIRVLDIVFTGIPALQVYSQIDDAETNSILDAVETALTELDTTPILVTDENVYVKDENAYVMVYRGAFQALLCIACLLSFLVCILLAVIAILHRRSTRTTADQRVRTILQEDAISKTPLLTDISNTPPTYDEAICTSTKPPRAT